MRGRIRASMSRSTGAVFACTTLIILTTGVLFGLAPAWFAARTEVSSSLKESAQTTTRRRRGLSGKALVGLQIALSTMLVVGAGLFLRTLTALTSQDVGFNTNNLVLFDINPPAARYPAGKDVALHQELERRIAALPGCTACYAGGYGLHCRFDEQLGFFAGRRKIRQR